MDARLVLLKLLRMAVKRGMVMGLSLLPETKLGLMGDGPGTDGGAEHGEKSVMGWEANAVCCWGDLCSACKKHAQEILAFNT